MSRTYVVTGAASGIGEATKQLLEERGHRVVGVDLAGSDLDLDLADAAQRAALPDRIADATGGSLDAVIAVAGTAAPTTVGVQVNYFGALASVEGLRPLLMASPSPRAVVVTSISVVHPCDAELFDALSANDETQSMDIAAKLVEKGEGGYIYTTSKRAIAAWVRRAAVSPEWAGAGIALNGFAPGTVVTPMTAPVLATPEGRAMVTRMVPMPLNGPAEPRHAAYLLAWLAGEENTHVTGQSIFLDGGAEAVMRGVNVFDGAAYPLT